MDIDSLKNWIDRTEQHLDFIDEQKVFALAATLDLPSPVIGQSLPPLWHWMYFWSIAAQAGLGDDGHPARGGFLPPVPLPRRMWAGGRLTFIDTLLVGSDAVRTSRILSVEAKTGKSGPLAFVTVEHRIAVEGRIALIEEHDIVYRELPRPDLTPAPAQFAPDNALWSREIRPDPVLLFRYSALTFNGHRIHYDRTYVTGVEGYPGLVVHGPLIATLLAGLVAEKLPTARLVTFNFRAVSPLFDTEPFTVFGQPGEDGETVKLWATNSCGALAMVADARVKLP